MAEPQVNMVRIDGTRRVAVHRLAEGDTGRTVVLCHPAPGAGTFDPDPDQTMARGVTLLAIDRPGYGHSDPVPDAMWASVSAAADDIATVLDRSTTGPVGVAGWSAGGRIALALAARHPHLVDRVVVLGTPAPHEHVPWIPADQQASLDSMRGLSAATARATLGQLLAELLPRDMGTKEAA